MRPSIPMTNSQPESGSIGDGLISIADPTDSRAAMGGPDVSIGLTASSAAAVGASYTTFDAMAPFTAVSGLYMDAWNPYAAMGGPYLSLGPVTPFSAVGGQYTSVDAVNPLAVAGRPNDSSRSHESSCHNWWIE